MKHLERFWNRVFNEIEIGDEIKILTGAFKGEKGIVESISWKRGFPNSKVYYIRVKEGRIFGLKREEIILEN